MRVLILIALLMAPALAQTPRGLMNWWDTPLVRDLNLSPDQRRQIQDTVREYRSKLIDLRAVTEKAEADVEDTFNDETLDQRRATDAIERLANARADLIRTFSQMSLRMRTVLTPDQWRELQQRRRANMEQRRDEMQERRMNRRGVMPRGPGGPPPGAGQGGGRPGGPPPGNPE